MHQIKLFILAICFLLFYQVSTVQAKETVYLSESELQSFGFTEFEDINPNLLVYPLKRGLEKIKLVFLLGREQKMGYSYQLFEVRFRELVYIINHKKEGFIPYAADRYISFLGEMKSEYPPDQNYRSQIQRYLKLLSRMRDIFPANSPNWQKIQQTTDVTGSLI